VIADLVVTLLVFRAGGTYRATCPEFGVTASAGTVEDARAEALRLVRRRVAALAGEGALDAFLADAGFVVDCGVLRTGERLVSATETTVTVQL